MLNQSMRKAMLSAMVAVFSAGVAAGEHYNVVLLGGQSNMTGRASISNLPTEAAGLANPQDDVLFYHDAGKTATDEANQRKLITLRSGSGTDFGPELSFGRTVADGMPGTKLALIKYAYGGTNLKDDWDPNTGSVYATFQTTINNGLAALTAAGHTYSISAMLWTQGEADVSRTTPEYQADLNELIAAVRGSYGSDLKFFMSALPDTQTWTSASKRAVVNDAQLLVAGSDPLAYVVNTDGFEQKSDNLHYNATGQVQLGEAFGEAYLSTVPEPSSLVLLGLGGLALLRRPRF